MRNEVRNIGRGVIASAFVLSLVACGTGKPADDSRTTITTDAEEQSADATLATVSEPVASQEETPFEQVTAAVEQEPVDDGTTEPAAEGQDTKEPVTVDGMVADGVVDVTDMFTKRDLNQTADMSDAQSIELVSGQDVSITEAGTYILSGTATDSTVYVEVADDAKVQLVLDGVSVTNSDSPAIYVRNADKVFVTTTEGSENSMQVTGAFVTDSDTQPDAVIFSKDDLTLNGLGKLAISSTGDGISCKDDLRVTGGTYEITSAGHALDANESAAISGGTLSLTAQQDGIHVEVGDDDTTGFAYICGGTFDIRAASDGVRATTYLQIDNGTLNIEAGEGLEATYVQVNGGSTSISASDDGINATGKSTAVGTPTIEIRGGDISIAMAQGDTDALDVNGNQVSEIQNSMMMGGGMGAGRGDMTTVGQQNGMRGGFQGGAPTMAG